MLDQLAFRAGSMVTRPWSTLSLPNTQVSIAIPGRSKSFSVPLPFYFAQTNLRADHADWPELCILFRRLGIPVVGTIADYEKLPAVAIPTRIGRRYAADRLDLNEITTADVFEIVCRSLNSPGQMESKGNSSVPMLPLEVDDPKRLRELVRLIRDVSSGDIPVGAAVRLNIADDDLAMLLDSDLDFLSLDAAAEPGVGGNAWNNWIVIHLVRVRGYCRSLGKPEFPILVDLPFQSIDWLIKTLALGATVVSVDGLVNAALATLRRAQPDSLSRGLLAGIAEPYAKPSKSVAAIAEETLNSLVDRLRLQMRLANADSLAQFDRARLISYEEQICRLTGAILVD